MNKEFFDETLKFVKSGDSVLDLGAGNGSKTERFLEKRARVRAVEKKIVDSPNLRINWVEARIEDYAPHMLPRELYDMIFIANVIQFLDKQWVLETLFPTLQNHLLPQGVIAVETFFQHPKPSIGGVEDLYSLKELLPLFDGWHILLSQQFDADRLDLKGNMRHFYLTDLIVRKRS